MIRALNILFYVVFVTLMVSVAGLLVASMLPIPGNIELKIVKSGSMEPTIPTGSLVIVKPMQSYGINDVITFGADTKTQIPTTHRIIAFEADENGRTGYRTKGDANEDPDTELVRSGEVIGKVVFHLPSVGFVLDFARQPLGFALLIGVPAALVILEEVITIAREIKANVRRRRRKEEGDDRDDEPSHGSRLREVVGPKKLVYLRRRAMDEIFVPMVIQTRDWVRERTPKPKDAYGAATVAALGVVCVSTMMSGGAKGTIAYFNDIERSLDNIFQAGEGEDFLSNIVQGPQIEPELETFSLMAAPEEEEEEGEVLGESDASPEPPPEVPQETEASGVSETTEPETIPPAEEVPEEAAETPEEAAEASEPGDDAAQTAPIEPQTPPEEPETAPEEAAHETPVQAP